jgi:hypothetical protein
MKKSKKVALRRLKKSWRNLVPVAGLFLFIFGVFGLMYVQKPLQESTSDLAAAQVINCNQICKSNADCETNFRCYDTGVGSKRCRLAANPTNNLCAAAGQVVQVATPKPASEKGTIVVTPVPTPDEIPYFPVETPIDTPIPTLTPEEIEREAELRRLSEQTAMDTLLNLLQDQSLSLPIIVTLLGVLLLVVSVVAHFLKKLLGVFNRDQDDDPKPPPKTKPALFEGPATKNGQDREANQPPPRPIAPPPKIRPQARLEHPLYQKIRSGVF